MELQGASSDAAVEIMRKIGNQRSGCLVVMGAFIRVFPALARAAFGGLSRREINQSIDKGFKHGDDQES